MILVTGAGGTVGSAVLEELAAAGQPVRAAYRSPDQARQAAEAGHQATVIDLADPTTLPAALDGVTSVFLLGAMSPDQTTQELNLVHAAKAAGVSNVVKLSVLRADEGLTPIARLHRPVEEALESSDLAWTFLRPNFYMQNFLRQAPFIQSTGTFTQPASAAPISFVDVRDVARVAASVLTSPGHAGAVHTVTGPAALTFDQVADTFTEILGKPVRFTGLSDEQARAGMLRGGLSEFYADALLDVSRAYRDGGAELITTTVSDLTGRAPTTFGQFVRDHRPTFA